ncbi:MAG: helix-turn-helix domain-containing protein [Mediterraneibacter gnavus]
MGFGSYFRDLRIEKQITQKQIADVIKKKPMLVSNVENGKNGPFSDNDLKKIVSFWNYQRMKKDSYIRKPQRREESYHRKCKHIS